MGPTHMSRAVFLVSAEKLWTLPVSPRHFYSEQMNAVVWERETECFISCGQRHIWRGESSEEKVEVDCHPGPWWCLGWGCCLWGQCLGSCLCCSYDPFGWRPRGQCCTKLAPPLTSNNTRENWSCHSLAEALRRECLIHHLGITIKMTLFWGVEAWVSVPWGHEHGKPDYASLIYHVVSEKLPSSTWPLLAVAGEEGGPYQLHHSHWENRPCISPVQHSRVEPALRAWEWNSWYHIPSPSSEVRGKGNMPSPLPLPLPSGKRTDPPVTSSST